MIASHVALTAARAVVTDMLDRQATLKKERGTATNELAEAAEEQRRLNGAAAIGESDPVALAAADTRHAAAEKALRRIVDGLALIDERLPAAQQALDLAEAAFRTEAAELIEPAHDRLAALLLEQAEALATTYGRLAQVATVRGRVPVGIIMGDSLLRGAGQPLEQVRRSHNVDLTLSFMKAPARLTEDQILQRLSWAEPEAAE
ncbi:MAG TPA: hypothetical protein VJN18_25120 [Polyangiaceae bacterium]|nr:hypothetical protein [Polyangiaceae bacterium]